MHQNFNQSRGSLPCIRVLVQIDNLNVMTILESICLWYSFKVIQVVSVALKKKK